VIKQEPNSWTRARQELERWSDAGQKANFWVRDDDAIDLSKDLTRLSDIATKYHARIGLALIPGQTSPQLIEFLQRDLGQFYPMCHGWKHINHNLGNKPAEFGPDRPIASLVADARAAFRRFNEIFGSVRAIFVPPFNRVTPGLIKSLPAIGFFGVSLMPGRLEQRFLQVSSRLNLSTPIKIPKFNAGRRIDVHVDVINWRTRTAQDTETIVRQIVHQLRARRLGFVKADAPIGLLTHHLAHDERVWRLLENSLDVLQSHPAVEFMDVRKWVEDSLPPSAPLQHDPVLSVTKTMRG
jgi:hypothetical protein